jgi:hypothetical protein
MPKKKWNYHKVNQVNKGTAHFKIFYKNIRELGKKAGELKSSASRLPSCLMPNRTSHKVFTIGKGSY